MRRVPPYAFCTAASKMRCEARQMSGPVPSPSMKGRIGVAGACRRPPGVRLPTPPRRPERRQRSPRWEAPESPFTCDRTVALRGVGHGPGDGTAPAGRPKAGLLLIEAGEPHEISNEGGDPSGGHQHLRTAGVLKHLRERRTGFASVLSEAAPAME